MSAAVTFRTPSWLTTACILVALQAGCTSALTTAYLRDGLWSGAEHAASGTDGTATARDDADGSAAESKPVPPAPAADRERREAALEEAMARLSHIGTLDPAVEAALVATLQRTQPEDWPVVVEEFAESLATAGVATTAPAAVTTGRPAGEPISPPTPEAEPRPADAAEPTADREDEPAIPVSADDMPPAAGPETAAAVHPAVSTSVPEPPLAVRSACFASAVRAWGDVDRFAADRFRPGQDVIVYVEVDNLSASASPAGHTTCMDAVLRLVDEAGTTLHTWTFEPVAETSPARRRDYFARYIVRIPETASTGRCRIEVDVTDARSGTTARTSIPLEIASAD